MISNMQKLIISIFAISLICNCSSSTNTIAKVNSAVHRIIPIINNGLKKLKIPGGYLVVTQKDKIIAVVSFGNNTVSSNNPKPVDDYTVFSVSSVSKNITAFVVGALVDAGIIKWDDKVRKYDKNFFLHSEELSDKLTIQDLISHCSGFKHFSADSVWSGGYPRDKAIDAFKYLNQKPGVFRKYYGYQNIIFGLR